MPRQRQLCILKHLFHILTHILRYRNPISCRPLISSIIDNVICPDPWINGSKPPLLGGDRFLLRSKRLKAFCCSFRWVVNRKRGLQFGYCVSDCWWNRPLRALPHVIKNFFPSLLCFLPSKHVERRFHVLQSAQLMLVLLPYFVVFHISTLFTK